MPGAECQPNHKLQRKGFRATPPARAASGVTTLAALILGREGMSNPENAKSFLSNVMGRTDNYLSLLHNDTLGSLSKFLPQPPSFEAPQVCGQGFACQGSSLVLWP